MNGNGNVNVTRQGPEAFQDNETGYADSYTGSGRDYKPPMSKALDFRVYAVWFLGSIVGFIVFFSAYGIWKWLYCGSFTRQATCQTLDAAEPIALGVILILPLFLIALNMLLKYWTRTRYENALANKANLVLNRYGDQEPADLYDRLHTNEVITMLAMRYELATSLERAVAPHKLYRGVNSLSIASSQTTNEGDQSVVDPTLAPLSPDQWLPIAYQQPHIMIGGATGEGKTITAKAVLLARLQSEEALYVIDPHSSNWYGIAGRGGGEQWHDVELAIADIFTEYKARIDERHQYLLVTGKELPEDHFPRLNVLIDEAFLIKENIDHASKKAVNYWTLLTEVMSSGARKIGISLILLTQTTNVGDLGISGPLRRNFFRIAVDSYSIREMIAREESDRERKTELLSSLIGMQYPATTEINGQICVLDRQGLLTLARTPIDAKSRLWIPTKTSVIQQQNGNLSHTLSELRSLRSQGVTRDQARNEYGIEFTNELWTIASEE